MTFTSIVPVPLRSLSIFTVITAASLALAAPSLAQEWVHGTGWQIWDDATANDACPSVCGQRNMSYTGYWEDDGTQNFTSWCYCDAAAPAPDPGMSPAMDTAQATPQGGGGFRDAVLGAHNTLRANHGAPQMAWSSALEQSAQNYANMLQQNGCAGGHSPATLRNGAGENLYSTGNTSPGFDPARVGQAAVESWYWCEIGLYPSPQAGHYTQVIWQNSTQLGCAMLQCDAGSQQVWPGQNYHVARVVCQYAPAGNITNAGQYERNVRHRTDLQKPAHVSCF
ncbi:CAP domain-containing protein [Pseudoponticoccus marisrubri]|uniref:SCP domain-containing protein n=1 Tax=Pseudoponticoccus marisrubri TaxID=1685382 RepID=A0A0W7WPY8_9RHOB|nr:CAP domain-containing protein [Pseudoponticoccus marisrubri]KUF12568.1 hypothetical protein AVJ23_02240 [Pseudoponticoccus marisrubri]